MRTRIALAAIIPVALITVSTLTQTATAPSARALPVSDSIAMPAHQLAAYHVTTSEHSTPGPSNLLSDLNTGLLAAHSRHRRRRQPRPRLLRPRPRPSVLPPPGLSIRSRRRNGRRGNEWPCARRAATGRPMVPGSAAASASPDPTGSPTAASNLHLLGPWPPRTNRSWWPNAFSPARRISTAAAAGSRGRTPSGVLTHPNFQRPIGTAGRIQGQLQGSIRHPVTRGRGGSLRGSRGCCPRRCPPRCRCPSGDGCPVRHPHSVDASTARAGNGGA